MVFQLDDKRVQVRNHIGTTLTISIQTRDLHLVELIQEVAVLVALVEVAVSVKVLALASVAVA